MGIGSYFPSAQFVLIAASIAVSGGLVFAADQFTNTQESAGGLSAGAPSMQDADIDWKGTLQEIQLRSGITLPEPPDEESVGELLAAAQSNNLTESVSRTLLINLTSAASQGLGSDIPTQEELIAQALAQINKKGAPAYTLAELPTAGNTPEALRSWGNAVMATLIAHPNASVDGTFRVLGSAVDKNSAALLASLKTIGAAYKAIAEDLATIPVPGTLAPLHLQVVNNFARIAGTYADMEMLPTDPLRGLAGLQTYQSLTDETARVFTTIAQQLQKSAILFTEDEPGSAWSGFLPTSL